MARIAFHHCTVKQFWNGKVKIYLRYILPKLDYFNLFAKMSILWTFIILNVAIFACRFNCGMVFYGLSFGVRSLAGSRYLNMFISGSVEAPAVLSVIYFNNWYKPTRSILISQLLQSNLITNNYISKLLRWCCKEIMLKRWKCKISNGK